jgi:NAD(P)H-dependent FMN reductase
MSQLFLPVILGTARPGRESEAVARHVLDVVKQRSVATDLIDVADYLPRATGREAAAGGLADFAQLATAADGFVIVAPEYNHGYPGELKLLLDSTFDGYVRKPVGFVSVSSGLIGGARLVEQLRLVAAALQMVPIAPAVHVPQVTEALDSQGRFADPSLQAVLDSMLSELERYAGVLSPARLARSEAG